MSLNRDLFGTQSGRVGRRNFTSSPAQISSVSLDVSALCKPFLGGVTAAGRCSEALALPLRWARTRFAFAHSLRSPSITDASALRRDGPSLPGHRDFPLSWPALIEWSLRITR
jgi:hypothetical protein